MTNPTGRTAIADSGRLEWRELAYKTLEGHDTRHGKKSRRAGLDRAKWLLSSGMATVFAVFKLSRLLRTCYMSVAFIQEEVVDQGYVVRNVVE